MFFLRCIARISNIGIKAHHLPWQVTLIRKTNNTAMLAFLNVSLGTVIFISLGYYQIAIESSICLSLIPLVFVFNKKFGYLPASYLFNLLGINFLFVIAIRMGSDAMGLLYYFPFLFGLMQIFSRKETTKHMAVLLFISLIYIWTALISFHFNYFKVELPQHLTSIVKYVNIGFSFFVTVTISLFLSKESFKQEALLEKTIKQKEVLLAELFHRVKNNLNIVTSILNLKKNSINSEEGKTALEECRNMVFSMALVHTRIYNSDNLDNLNFRIYLDSLISELVNSFGGKNNVEIEVNSSKIDLNLTQAIPCGLIINEFITNAFKHAQVENQKLKILLTLIEINGVITIELKDNGPGLMTQQEEKNSLGLDLIKSLTEQLNGECGFKNNKGFQFNLKFKKVD
ncbi:MAG: sensor histidine kinase [Bacteroidota bacterium]|nr:sensor histidine kinase [Bacteroidota bacterium]MDP3146140.1 sensor histidine kinase [Bacteroidota bacterium]